MAGAAEPCQRVKDWRAASGPGLSGCFGIGNGYEVFSGSDKNFRIEAHGGNGLPVSVAGMDGESVIELADGLCSMSATSNQQNSSGQE